MLGERLRAARHARFVGRTAEKELFQSTLTTTDLPFNILYIFGPGGVGKTTLLQEFIFSCEHYNVPVYYLDARNVDPSPDGFNAALRRAMGITAELSVRDTLASQPRCVILVDTDRRAHV